MKTNAARLLDSLGIAYEVREYEVDPDDLAAHVARQRLHFLERDGVDLLVAREQRERLQIELLIARHDREADAVAIAARDERLEHLLRRHPHFARNRLRGQILGIDFVLAHFVPNPERVEQARRVRLRHDNIRRRFTRSFAPHAYLYSSAPRRKSNVVCPSRAASSIACATTSVPMLSLSCAGSWPPR